MDFLDVVDQVVALLRSRGRITYRALKRQFTLDDDVLEDLKAEIISGQRLAVDEDGSVLVWTGGEAPTSTPLGTAGARPECQSIDIVSPPVVPQPPDAERRQLTVMFCDLADSTTLAGQLDPEDLRAVLRAYQQTSAEVIQRYEGHIAQYLGDGLLVYFGWPQAHEDDAQRAVHAGLGILAAIQGLNTRLQQEKGIRVAVRIGLHTGPVVVGEMGGGGRHEHLALGDTPNIAARLQGVAVPDTVAVSAATFRLIQGYFVCDELGPYTLKGVPAPMPVYRVQHASGVQSRLEVAATRGLTPLIGREQEVALLQERWGQVQDGFGQVILLSGEAGIGKSRLVHMLKEHVAPMPHTRLECRTSPYYRNTALYPLTDLLHRTLAFRQDDTAAQRLAKLEQTLGQYQLPFTETVSLFAPLLSLQVPEERYAPLSLSPQRRRQKLLEALLAIFLELAAQQPVVFIVEDLHWVDPSTLDFLSLLVDQAPTVRLYSLWTFRPDFVPPWTGRAHLTPLTLTRLAPQQVERLITTVARGKPLPAAVVQQIVARTDGVPLFVEELTKAVLESGMLHEGEEHYALTGPLTSVGIPATLQDALMARLDRLGAAKGVAQLGATIGRTFAYDLLQAVAALDETTLQQSLRQLVEAELVYQRGIPPQATYTFKHALIQDAAYQSLLRSTRQQYHQQIAQVIEAHFPALVETQPELLAHHYTEAGLTEQAIPYWQRAGQQASDRSAHLEAVSHLTTGIALLKALPETPAHTRQALSLHIALGAALQIAKGLAAPEVEQAYTRARELCQQVGETPQLVPVLFGLWRFYLAQSQLHTARELGETLLRLAQRADDPALAVIAHYTLGATWLSLGVLPAARQHLEAGIARDTPDQRRAPVVRIGQDLGISCQANAARTLWLLGYSAQAVARLHEALASAYALSHPYSLAFVRCWAAMVSQLCRDVPAVHEHAEATVALSTEQGFPLYAAMGTSIRGWALAMQGQGEAGMVQVHQGIAALRATGAALWGPYFCTVLADVSAHLGHPADGLQALAEAYALVEQHEERWWEAEVCRLRGVLLLRQPGTPQAEAEVCFQRALDVACRQEAKSLELRAAMSLARLWQRQGKTTAAHQLLAPIYGWFTEGFDTVDLQEARALLEELA
jgi:class 3 adenylate cyclase/predicted ATPase